MACKKCEEAKLRQEQLKKQRQLQSANGEVEREPSVADKLTTQNWHRNRAIARRRQ